MAALHCSSKFEADIGCIAAGYLLGQDKSLLVPLSCLWKPSAGLSLTVSQPPMGTCCHSRGALQCCRSNLLLLVEDALLVEAACQASGKPLVKGFELPKAFSRMRSPAASVSAWLCAVQQHQ
jgi:hypothetical protein